MINVTCSRSSARRLINLWECGLRLSRADSLSPPVPRKKGEPVKSIDVHAVKKAESLIEFGDCEKAIEICNQLLAGNSHDAGLYNTRGNAYFCLKNYRQAVADYNKALKLNPRFIFNGLLIGAAVGGGFGAFESLDYVVHSGESYMDQMIHRSVNIFGAHLMWAAIEGGALVMVKGNDTLSLSHFTDARFLTYLAIPMGLHFTGNYDIHLMRVPFFIDLKFLLMCGVAVYVVGILINKAIVQVLTYADKKRRLTPTNEEEIINPQSSTSRRAILTALTGPLKGKAFPFTDKVTIGRKADVCNIIFPRDTPGVSKRHCELKLRSDGIYIMDTESGKGTFF